MIRGASIWYWFSLLTPAVLLASALAFASMTENTTSPLPPVHVKEDSPPPEVPETTEPYFEIPPFRYNQGDWEKHIIVPPRPREDEETGTRSYTSLYRNDDVEVISYGSVKMGLVYGGSVYTKDKWKKSDTDKPVSRIISPGLLPHQEMQVHVEGRIGPRVTVYIDHDSQRQENTYRMQYRALTDDELIQEINAGEIDIKFNNSKYAVYDNTSARGLGIDMTLKKDRFSLRTFGSVLQGENETEVFRGNAAPGSQSIQEYKYVHRKHYQVEPYRRYESSLPVTIPTSNALHSTDPAVQNNVNINPSGFKIYRDDQNPDNNQRSIQLSLDGGYYDLMVNGRDYTINYTSGLITFTRPLDIKDRVFVVYNDPSSDDPSAIAAPAEFPDNDYLVFIKYGPEMEEDTDRDGTLDRTIVPDGVINYDAYEVRSFYQLSNQDLNERDFRLAITRQGEIIDDADSSTLGPYNVDYRAGLIRFNLREPFRQLLSSQGISVIYTENQPASVTDYSRYELKADYLKKARSFKLAHENIIEDTVFVNIDGIRLDKSRYTVDHSSGFLIFTDPNHPHITSDTEIEVRYQYLPFGARSSSFVGGARSDYRLTKDITLGGSVLFHNEGGTGTIPDLGNEPSRTLLVEADARLHIPERRMSNLIQRLAKNETLDAPVELELYGEYDRSYRQVNTFGKALVDNMESNDLAVGISLSEKDWILSSLPSGTRGVLNYRYYRKPGSPEELKTLSYTPTDIPYATKPGPYNVAHGHLPSDLRTESQQRSLTLDYDFTAGDTVSVVTRRLSSTPVDLSGLQYIEISYRMTGGGSADISFDLGRVNEDSDGDGILDTEDTNGNGILDVVPGTGIDEDTGYDFGGVTTIGSGPGLSDQTSGNGVLNSEDLNGNGTLDPAGQIVNLPLSGTETLTDTGGAWKTLRIYLDPDDPGYPTDPSFLKAVEAVRINLKQNSGNTGVLYIDDIRMVASRWHGVEKDAGGDTFRISIVNSLSDAAYSASAFHQAQAQLYRSLYGEKDSQEMAIESESALQVEYNLSASQSGSVTRFFSQPVDMRFYKTLVFWLYNASGTSPPADAGVRVRIGSSDTDYMEFTTILPEPDIWREYSCKLTGSSSGDIEPVVTGRPDLKRVRYIKVTIDPGAGGDTRTLWFNEFYLTEPESQVGDAHWVEARLEIKKPLFKTKNGTPVLSDIHIRYVKKGNSRHFDSIGKETNELAEDRHELQTSMNILPSWTAFFTFSQNNSNTESLNEEVPDEQRGEVMDRSIYVETRYQSKYNGVPSVLLSYRHDNRNQDLTETVNTNQVNHSISTLVHEPIIRLTERIKNFLWGTLAATASMNLIFKEEKENRPGPDLSLDRKEQRQSNDYRIDLEYRNRFFYLKPAFKASTEEVVNLKGESDTENTEIEGPVNGGFHAPFDYSNTYKLVNRTTFGSFSLGMTDFWYLAPRYELDINYNENDFRDHTFGSGDFERLKDAQSLVSTRLSLPLHLNKLSKLRFLKTLSLNYQRSLYLNETDIPYEGEGVPGLDETYGISRAMNGLANPGLNIFQFFPGYFFGGRQNFGHGRDLTRRTLNSLNPHSSYDNDLKLIDTFSFNWNMDFDSISYTSNARLSQTAQRQNVQGIPTQVVTAGFSLGLNFNLMKLIDHGFFRDELKRNKNHSFSIDVGYSFDANLMITSNIESFSHTPRIGFTVKWGRSYFGFRTGFDIRHQHDREFISWNDSERDHRDDIYIENMPEKLTFRELDFGWTMNLTWETDVKWLYNLFSKAYKLVAPPIFTASYDLALNRYDYTSTLSPEPYDSHLFTLKLSMDIHKNIQGSLHSRLAVEQYRHRDTDKLTGEVFSYELGFNFSLIF